MCEGGRKRTAVNVLFSDRALFICTVRSCLPAAVKVRHEPAAITAVAKVPGDLRGVAVMLGGVPVTFTTGSARDATDLAFEFRRLVWTTQKKNLPLLPTLA